MTIGFKVELDLSALAGIRSELLKRSVTLKGVRAGAKVLQRAAKAAAPRRKGSGALRQSQGVKAAAGRKGKTIAYAVQGAKKATEKMVTLPGRNKPERVIPAFYDHLVQGGTKPHRLGKGESIGRDAKGRRKGRAATAQATGARHPGAKPNPYRKRAYEANKAEIGAAINTVMGEEVKRLMAREGAKLKGK